MPGTDDRHLGFRAFFRLHLEAEAPDARGQERVEAFLKSFYPKHGALSKFQAVPVVYMNRSPYGDNPEAQCLPRQIALYEKFFGLDPRSQDFAFTHELGHWALAHTLGLSGLSEVVDVWDNLPFGQPNGEEAFADSFASYFLVPGELQAKFPAWVRAVESVLASYR